VKHYTSPEVTVLSLRSLGLLILFVAGTLIALTPSRPPLYAARLGCGDGTGPLCGHKEFCWSFVIWGDCIDRGSIYYIRSGGGGGRGF
jgi:hypothetical protein